MPKGPSWNETKMPKKDYTQMTVNSKQAPASLKGWNREGPCVAGEGRVGVPDILFLESGESGDIVSSERNTKEKFQCIMENHRNNPTLSSLVWRTEPLWKNQETSQRELSIGNSSQNCCPSRKQSWRDQGRRWC